MAWRSGFDVFRARVEPDEAGALEAALAGAPLWGICAPFERREDPAGAALAALSSWLDEGWVAALTPCAPAVPGAPARGRTSGPPAP